MKVDNYHGLSLLMFDVSCHALFHELAHARLSVWHATLILSPLHGKRWNDGLLRKLDTLHEWR
jgi:hypothetical protein